MRGVPSGRYRDFEHISIRREAQSLEFPFYRVLLLCDLSTLPR